MTLLKEELDRSNIVVPERIDGAGRATGGRPFSRGHLYKLLSNPIYAGQIAHKGRVHAGQHPPIVEPATWDAVQAKLALHTRERRQRIASSDHLLTGRIRDDRGHPMSPTHAQKGSRRYSYYVSAALQQGTGEAGTIRRVAAGAIEAAVCEALRSIAGPGEREGADLVGSHLRQVTVRADALSIELQDGEMVEVPWSRTSGQRRREIIVPPGCEAEHLRPARSEDRARILQAIARGRAWLEELAAGRIADPDAIAIRERCSERSVRNTLSLAFLSPEIVRTIVAGEMPRGVGLARLAELPSSWDEQHEALGM